MRQLLQAKHFRTHEVQRHSVTMVPAILSCKLILFWFVPCSLAWNAETAARFCPFIRQLRQRILCDTLSAGENVKKDHFCNSSGFVLDLYTCTRLQADVEFKLVLDKMVPAN